MQCTFIQGERRIERSNDHFHFVPFCKTRFHYFLFAFLRRWMSKQCRNNRVAFARFIWNTLFDFFLTLSVLIKNYEIILCDCRSTTELLMNTIQNAREKSARKTGWISFVFDQMANMGHAHICSWYSRIAALRPLGSTLSTIPDFFLCFFLCSIWRFCVHFVRVCVFELWKLYVSQATATNYDICHRTSDETNQKHSLALTHTHTRTHAYK